MISSLMFWWPRKVKGYFFFHFLHPDWTVHFRRVSYRSSVVAVFISTDFLLLTGEQLITTWTCSSITLFSGSSQSCRIQLQQYDTEIQHCSWKTTLWQTHSSLAGVFEQFQSVSAIRIPGACGLTQL